MCLIQLHYRFTVTLFPAKELLYIIRVIYNGHKRVHALKFQCVALPNGLIGNLFGPVGKFFGECLYKERVGDFNFTMFLTRNIGRVPGVKSERLI